MVRHPCQSLVIQEVKHLILEMGMEAPRQTVAYLPGLPDQFMHRSLSAHFSNVTSVAVERIPFLGR